MIAINLFLFEDNEDPTHLGGKMDPSGPVPPNPEGSGCRASGLNLNVASLGRNLSKLVTAGTVGTLSVTGRWLGWNLRVGLRSHVLPINKAIAGQSISWD